eukprot:847576_1
MATVWITRPSQSKFEEKYTKLKPIGEAGSFGKAYQIQRKSDKKILAVKEISKAKIYRLHPSDVMRQSLLKSMEAEIDIMRRLNHKYIVNMYETYETKHTLHICMEECRGGELFERIKQRGKYTEAACKPIIKQICEALFYMHDQHRVVHCDLKPDNILFVNKSENSVIKMIDFGMSKVLPRLRSLRELCGTPYYTAPEIIKGDYAHGCDMWSTGVIMFVMLFGFPPFYVDPTKYYGQREAQAIYRLIQKGFDPKVKRGYGPWFPRKMPVSDEAKDLMALLMDSDTSKRLTAKEALQHPWILSNGITSKKKTKKQQQNNIDDEKDTQEITKELGYQFANFATSNQFKHAITALFRDKYEKMRPQ